jgi:hypothetical protein
VEGKECCALKTKRIFSVISHGLGNLMDKMLEGCLPDK